MRGAGFAHSYHDRATGCEVVCIGPGSHGYGESMAPTYRFSAPLWEPDVEPAWVFLSLPTDRSDEISDLTPDAPGFGSVPVSVTIGGSNWKTSLFPSKQAATYVLPVKRAVRQAEGIDVGDVVEVTISLRLDDQ